MSAKLDAPEDAYAPEKGPDGDEEEEEEEGEGAGVEGEDQVRELDAVEFEAYLFSKKKHDVVRASKLELAQLEEAQKLKVEEQQRSTQEEPRKVILSKRALRVVEGGACDFYTVRLSHPPEADVMVQIEDPSGQVRASPKVVRFSFDAVDPTTPGYWATPQKVRVMAVDDDNVEAMRETASLVHCSLSGDLSFSSVNGRCVIDPMDLPVDIVDNDGACIFSFGEINGARTHYPVAQSLRAADATDRRRSSAFRISNARQSKAATLRERLTSVESATSATPALSDMSIRSVGCGGAHFAIVLADGRVFTAGRGAEGQLCHGDFKQRVDLSPWRSIDRDGILRSKITQVACGAAHTALVTDDGRLLMCGSNLRGQLGICEGHSAGCGDCLRIRERPRAGSVSGNQQAGDASGKSVAPAVAPHSADTAPRRPAFAQRGPQPPRAQSAAAAAAGKSGSGARSGLRGGGCAKTRTTRPLESSTACAVPRVVESLTHLFVERVACGDHHTVVLASTGSSHTDRGVVKCRIFGWGDSSSGALGCGISGQVRHPVELTDLDAEDPFQISCGSRHTAVLCGEGRLFTAGWGIKGCVGRRRAEDDDRLNYFDRVTVSRASGPAEEGVYADTPTFVDISSGHSHLAALADTHEVYTCGENECGQLGLGDKVYRSALTKVSFLSGAGVASLACGMFHSAAITWEGNLYVWGSNDNGQLGLGAHILHQTVPCLHSVATGEAKQICTGHAHSVVVMHKNLENPTPARAQLQKQHEARLRHFWATKRKHDRQRQAQALSQDPQMSEREQRRREREAQRKIKREQRLEEVSRGAKTKLAGSARLPFPMVAQFSPRIMTRKGREAESIAETPRRRGPKLEDKVAFDGPTRSQRKPASKVRPSAPTSVYGYDNGSPGPRDRVRTKGNCNKPKMRTRKKKTKVSNQANALELLPSANGHAHE